MPRYSTRTIKQYFQDGHSASNTYEKGKALENLLCYLFAKIPGVTISKRNIVNTFQTEEIDVAFWNEKHARGLYFLPHTLLAECKNWSSAVSGREISYFAVRLQNRGLGHGILLAAAGITGSANDLHGAHFEMAMALSHGIHIMVVTRREIEFLKSPKDLVRLLKHKLCELAVSGSVFLEKPN